MKTIIYYYSLTGQCEHLANKIAGKLECDSEKIVEQKKRLSKGFLKFFNGGSAMQKKSAKINPVNNDPALFDRIILVTPFWAANPTPGARGFLESYREDLKSKKLGLVLTNLGTDPKEVIPHYKELFPGPVVIKSFTKAKDQWKEPKESELINQFILEINN